eukprot:TRINITY_DN1488_c1_g1_i1.p1 TRINITY_DN1488_c1_g1~~TRINITY_DN1488_c1_g1_i1.p1  ORF type:complete len:367 (-),score=82.65 TRINITY_DN1488_c1_g1_i1:254-1354(-)
MSSVGGGVAVRSGSSCAGGVGVHPNSLVARRELERQEYGRLCRLARVRPSSAVAACCRPRSASRTRGSASRPSSATRQPSHVGGAAAPPSTPAEAPYAALYGEEPQPFSPYAAPQREISPSRDRTVTSREASALMSPQRRLEEVQRELNLSSAAEAQLLREELEGWYFGGAGGFGGAAAGAVASGAAPEDCLPDQISGAFSDASGAHGNLGHCFGLGGGAADAASAAHSGGHGRQPQQYRQPRRMPQRQMSAGPQSASALLCPQRRMDDLRDFIGAETAAAGAEVGAAYERALFEELKGWYFGNEAISVGGFQFGANPSGVASAAAVGVASGTGGGAGAAAGSGLRAVASCRSRSAVAGYRGLPRR